MRSNVLSVLVLAVMGVGCADRTSLRVEVTSDDLAVPADVDGLRFQVSSESGHSSDGTYAISDPWPHSLAVLPASPQEGRVTITVTGLLGGAPVVRRIVETAFSPGEQRTVSVHLDRACVGLPCPDGVDCIAGRCVGVTTDGGVDAGSDGGADAGADAGMDGGRTDGGADAATGDAGRGDAGVRDAGTDSGDAGRSTPMLLLTEYVEGDSNNKALEIQNLAATSFDLSRCELLRYSNGMTAAFVIPLTGTVDARGFHVICNGSIVDPSRCDQLTGALNHNGDDAYALACDGAATPLDTFGQIGVDPGVEWTGGGASTLDFVLTRRCAVTSGDPNGSDAFDPSLEWEGAAWTDAAASLAGLGSRGECP